jgi:hypothetical protein
MFASFQKRRLQAICMRKFAPVLANPWQEILARKRLQMRMACSAALREVERRHQKRGGFFMFRLTVVGNNASPALSPQNHAAARNKIANAFSGPSLRVSTRRF